MKAKSSKNTKAAASAAERKATDKKAVKAKIKEIVQSSPIEPIIDKSALSAEEKQKATAMTRREVRNLLDTFYKMQDHRLSSENQVRAYVQAADEGSTDAIGWVARDAGVFEHKIENMLGHWAKSQHMGRWALNIMGIGPVIAASLLAYLDDDKPTAGHIWAIFGYDPSKQWIGAEKAKDWVKNQEGTVEDKLAEASRFFNIQIASLRRFATTEVSKTGIKNVKLTNATLASALARRPWCAFLKTLGFKIGDSFIKVSNNPQDIYGKIFQQRKEYEWDLNEKGKYGEQAAAVLRSKPTHAQKDWYSGCFTAKAALAIRAEADQKQRDKLERDLRGEPGSGIHMLPPGHILSRARRYAVKFFLSHWHAEAYRNRFGKEPPKPFAIAQLGHAHYRKPPALQTA
jgi:hypothetical protein